MQEIFVLEKFHRADILNPGRSAGGWKWGSFMVVELEPTQINSCPILLVEANLSAGFPSPAADYVEGRIDLSEVLVPHPSASFTLRIAGHSMVCAGIHDGDLAIVDRSLVARHDNVIVAVLAGELTCKRLLIRNGRTYLAPDSDDPQYRTMDVTGREDFQVWGVVSFTIRDHRR